MLDQPRGSFPNEREGWGRLAAPTSPMAKNQAENKVSGPRGKFLQRGFCTSWTRIWGRILGCEVFGPRSLVPNSGVNFFSPMYNFTPEFGPKNSRCTSAGHFADKVRIWKVHICPLLKSGCHAMHALPLLTLGGSIRNSLACVQQTPAELQRTLNLFQNSLELRLP